MAGETWWAESAFEMGAGCLFGVALLLVAWLFQPSDESSTIAHMHELLDETLTEVGSGIKDEEG